MAQAKSAISPLTQTLAVYVASALKRPLPADVTEKSKHHILDSIAAIISGTRLLPGQKALSYLKSLGGKCQASIPGTTVVTSAINAALINGMLAHADETNDFHAPSYTHPGCSIVPAALATGELAGCSGTALLKAVVLGYDIACRTTMAMHPLNFHKEGHCTHSFGGTFGAAAAAGALLNLSRNRIPYLFSYAGQQASGCSCSARDKEHIGKAFDFGGMPARNGVTAATMVAHGFTGVDDIFSGERNFFHAYARDANQKDMIRGLGRRYEIMNASLKKYSVGSVIQAPLESLLVLMNRHRLDAQDVERLIVWISQEDAGVVNNRTMPDINLQFLMAVMILDRTLNFASTHDVARMKSRSIKEIQQRIELRGSAELSASRVPRQGIVEITTRNGRTFRHHTRIIKGVPGNRMTAAEVEEKTRDLVEPVLGKQCTRKLIDAIWNLERIKDVKALRRYCCR